MNSQILLKCIEELKKENPKIDYILGMLETVVAMSGNIITPIAHDIPTVKKQIEIPESISEQQTEPNPFTKAGPIGRITTS
jgi:hypothetical protein